MFCSSIKGANRFPWWRGKLGKVEEIALRSAASDLVRISKKLSYLLRHSTAFIDDHGWAQVTSIIAELQKGWPDFTMDHLRKIVATDEKGRYSFDQGEKRIRANQGHSIPVDVDLKRMKPPAVLYHGTATRFLGSILAEGLTGQSRLYVHLSDSVETAVKVGQRHGKPVVLSVDSARMVADGYEFYLSENGVWLTKQVPANYLVITDGQE